MQTKTIDMPLVIGAHELKNKSIKPIAVSTAHLLININLHNDKYLKSFIKSQNQGTFICSYNLLNDHIVEVTQQQIANLLNFSNVSDIEHSKFHIYKGGSNQLTSQDDFRFSFRTQIQSFPASSRFDVIIEQQNLSFQLLKITLGVKFVKNQLLLEILETSSSSG